MEKIYSIHEFKMKAKEKMHPESYEYLEGGAEDERTLRKNIDDFSHFKIRPRRLIDVTVVDSSIQLFGEHWHSPIVLCPIGTQGIFHAEGELGTARAADQKDHLMMVSSLSTFAYAEIADQMKRKPWFQLYPTTNREITKELLRRAENNGCKVLILTIDVPVPGNRERSTRFLLSNDLEVNMQKGNLDPLVIDETFFDPAMSWDIIPWLKAHCNMRIVLKGIMTEEDASLSIKYGVDAIVVSNHGGRQLESDLSTIECLEEVVAAIKGEIPVLIDGGFRRGSDIFKAMALGADAVCIGRAFIYGLAVDGQKGVASVLDLLQEELIRTMQLAGVTSFKHLPKNMIKNSG